MMKLPVVAAFCRRMGTGLKAGVDILRLLENETRSGSKKHRETMSGVLNAIREGNTLAKALLLHKSYFPPLLIQLTHASELGGRLDGMFLYMADYYDQLKATRSYFIGRITWPMIQLGMAIVIIGLVILLQGILSNTEYDASGLGLRGVNGFFCLRLDRCYIFRRGWHHIIWHLEELVWVSQRACADRSTHPNSRDRIRDA